MLHNCVLRECSFISEVLIKVRSAIIMRDHHLQCGYSLDLQEEDMKP